jgi:excisionase family DNA binding protein
VGYVQPNITGRAAYSIAEVMLQSGLGRDTIYKAIRQGQLKARKIGRRTIVLATDLQAFLESLPVFGEPAE